MANSPSLFAPTLEALLSGLVICESANPELFRFLENDAHRAEVEQYLERLRRGLRQTSDRLAWFACYLDLEDPSVRGVLAQRFGETINDLEPLVAWLRATSLVRSSGATLQAGDELRTSALIGAIEQAPALAEPRIDFLERDDVGIHLADDVHDPARIALSVRPHAFVDVVGGHHQLAGSCLGGAEDLFSPASDGVERG